MEGCTEATARAALKSSLRSELATQQVFFDDVLFCATGISCVQGEEYFSVDDLLDFSNGDFEEQQQEEEDGSVEEEEEDEKDSLSGSSSQDRTIDVDDNNSNSSSFCASQSFLTNHELLEPVVDFAELEWVSRFVDDSSPSELSLLCPSYGVNRSEPELNKPVTMIKTPCVPSSVPSKARTKRTRPAGRVWSLGLPVLADSPVSSSSSSGLSPSPSPTHEWLSGGGGGFGEPAVKKLKKKPAVQTGGGLFQRRCSHCQIQKTPQWRTGPLGPKTLCNACGVRFKSGRLFPEYRPACSPTFSRDVHSNSHRKVLEMRKKKESAGPEVGLTQMVQSF